MRKLGKYIKVKLLILINYLNKVKIITVGCIVLCVCLLTFYNKINVIKIELIKNRAGIKHNDERIKCTSIELIAENSTAHLYELYGYVFFNPDSLNIRKKISNNQAFYAGKIVEYAFFRERKIINIYDEGDFYKIPSGIDSLYNVLVLIHKYTNNRISCDSITFTYDYYKRFPFNDTIIHLKTSIINHYQADSILNKWDLCPAIKDMH